MHMLTRTGAAGGMESVPAALSGVILALFGAVLLLWTTVRLRAGRPVAQGVPPATAAVLAGVFGVISLMTGGWMLLSG